jgi:hypothetical protein
MTNLLVVVALAAATASIVISLFFQVWIPAIQLRRFARIFADRPKAIEAYKRVLAVYGWRARLAIKLFKIPPPPGSSD